MGSLLDTLFECLFWNVFSDAIFEPSDAILELLGTYLDDFGYFFVAFSYLGSFLKIVLPCGRELKNQGPGVTEIAQKSNKKCVWLWDCFGNPVFQEIIQFWLKNTQKGTPTWTPKLG